MSTEETKLHEKHIGLININNDSASNIFKVKLNLSEIKNYSVFEGEVIVAEGFNDMNGNFNANRIFKPLSKPHSNTYDSAFLK